MTKHNYEEFCEYCDKGICLRNTIISKNCSREYKRLDCYNKYNKKNISTPKIDEEWKEVVNKVTKRDKGECQLWKILYSEEREHIFKNFFEEYRILKLIDPCHIKGKGAFPELKYDVNNIVLCRRYFHSLLDQYLCPVLKSPITKEEREQWFLDSINGFRTIPNKIS